MATRSRSAAMLPKKYARPWSSKRCSTPMGGSSPHSIRNEADFKIELPEGQRDLAPAVIDLLASYQIERHIRKDKDERVEPAQKEVQLSPEFQALWDRIKPKTTYRVEFETDELVRRAVDAIKQMEKIERPTIDVRTGQIDRGTGWINSDRDIRSQRASRCTVTVPFRIFSHICKMKPN